MNWRFTGNAPVYQQIVSLMQGAVLSGEYPPGSRIPSVRELAAEARVNPNTMQRAMIELERRNLLVSGGTAGRCVTADESALEQARQSAIRELARECAGRFAALGLTPAQAGEILGQAEIREANKEE